MPLFHHSINQDAILVALEYTALDRVVVQTEVNIREVYKLALWDLILESMLNDRFVKTRDGRKIRPQIDQN